MGELKKMLKMKDKMKEIFEEIRRLEKVNTFSKSDKIVNGILNAVNDNILKRNDPLPSVNSMIEELGYARQTIVNAYHQLVHSGVVESKNRVGYFVAKAKSDQTLKVALVLYALDTFQETFYDNFRNNLGETVQLDIYFHHYNWEIFKNTIEDLNGKYGKYVIASIPDRRTRDILKILPSNRVLLVDRYNQSWGEYNYIAQEFKKSSYDAFLGLKDKIKKYDKFIFYFKKGSADPHEIYESFNQFIKEYDINGVVEEVYHPEAIEKGNVYFTISNLELWQMLKDAKNKGFEIGKDIGFISHNDDIVKEIIFDGITTFSTDFARMGREAALFITESTAERVNQIIPTILIDRNSL